MRPKTEMELKSQIITEDDPRFAELRALRNRVFEPDTRCMWRKPPERPFRESAWKTILVPAFMTLGAECDAAPGFTWYSPGSKDKVDVDPDWPRRDGLPEIMSWSDPLIWCLEKRGRDSLIFTNDQLAEDTCRGDNGYRPLYLVAPVDLQELTDGILEVLDMIPNKAENNGCLLFDHSCEWGSADFENIDWLIGGTPAFYDQYCEASGGEDYVRAWYYYWSVCQMQSGPYEFGCDLYFPLTDWPYDFLEEYFPYYNKSIDWSSIFGDRIKVHGENENGTVKYFDWPLK